MMGASAINTAVAGIVLGTKKVPWTLDENTDKTTPPLIPEARDATSAASPGTYDKK